MTGRRNPSAFPGIGDSVCVPSHLLMTGSPAVSTLLQLSLFEGPLQPEGDFYIPCGTRPLSDELACVFCTIGHHSGCPDLLSLSMAFVPQFTQDRKRRGPRCPPQNPRHENTGKAHVNNREKTPGFVTALKSPTGCT